MENITQDIKDKILNLYNDPKIGLTTNAKKYYDLLNKKIKLKDIKLVLSNIENI